MFPDLLHTPLAYWVHNLSPFLIRFNEDFGIRYYGLAYCLGFIVAAMMLRHYYKKGRSPLNPEQQATFMTFCIGGVLIGGRVGYMFLYDFGSLLSNPFNLFKVWEGGMSSHGGFVGVILALILFCRRISQPLLKVGDVIATIVPPGLFFGRVANFINGELWGKVSTVPWAVIFPQSAEKPGVPVESIAPRHPSQLYEAALEGLLLWGWTQFRFWRSPSLPPGQLSGEFLLGYAVVRIFAEIFREPDRGISLILGLSRGQFYSIFLAFGGIALLLYSHYREQRRKRNASETE